MSTSIILNSLTPVFLLIAAGFVMCRSGFPGNQFWPLAERLTYFILFPALLFQSTATAGFGDLTVLPVLIAASITVLIMTALLLLIRPILAIEPKPFTSLFQGSIRFNTYVGFTIAFAIFGKIGLTWAAVIIALLIPLVNFLSVLILIFFANEKKTAWHKHWLAVLKTPPLLACLSGMIYNLSGLPLPDWTSETMLLFGRASLPLGLLAVGAGLDLRAIRAAGQAVGLGSFLKLAALPLLMGSICSMLKVDHIPMVVGVLFAALPGSASSYILARQLGGDSSLMASIVSAQIIISLLTLPITLYILMI